MNATVHVDRQAGRTVAARSFVASLRHRWVATGLGLLAGLSLGLTLGLSLAWAVVSGPGAMRGAEQHGLGGASDPGRLLGPLSLLLGRDHAAEPREPFGTLRFRHRFLSWHELTPLQRSGDGVFVAGQLAVVEDSDDDLASTIVYRFASDGTIVASAPTGALLGTIDPADRQFRAQLSAAPRQRIVVPGHQLTTPE